MRKIHIDNEVYKYKVGGAHVKIRLPNGKSIAPTISEVTGLDWNSIERAIWKRYFRITPNTIKEYLMKTL